MIRLPCVMCGSRRPMRKLGHQTVDGVRACRNARACEFAFHAREARWFRRALGVSHIAPYVRPSFVRHTRAAAALKGSP